MHNYELHSPPSPGHAPIKTWTRGVPVDPKAVRQLRNVAALPFVFRHVAAMPDMHWGLGATVGSVIATRGAVIPAAVGVDIGCGMIAQRTSLSASDLPDNLRGMRSAIEQAVPHGRTHHGGRNDKGAWDDVPRDIATSWNRNFARRYKQITGEHPKAFSPNNARHLGTLGTGNHFVEVCLDTDQRVWVMLHSGSRGMGNRIGTYFIRRAKEDMRRHLANLPDKDLAYLSEGTELFDDYLEAVSFAQSYAAENRRQMTRRALAAIENALGCSFSVDAEAVNCHHNYVAPERHFGSDVLVTRKGAVRAREGDLGIIPGSMGARSYIVRGKGNPESFCSCAHGAGRVMSRTAAKKRFTLKDHAAATEGVECRKDAEVIDETPGAYKEIDAVMAAQQDLVRIVHTLKQVVCVKG